METQTDSRLDSQKNRPEIDRLIARIEAHLRQGAILSLCEDTYALKNCTIYSNCEAYRKWNTLKPDVIQCLFRGLSFPQFLEIPTGPCLYKFDILQALDGIAEEVTLVSLFSLSEHLGSLPGERAAPHLFQRLAETPDEAVTLWLHRWIKDRLPEEAAHGAAFSSHLKTISTFTLRWTPDDKDLSGAVKLLCLWDDPLAQQWTAEYLFSLPWGQDRQATQALLSGLAQAKTPPHRRLLQEALAHYDAPFPLRLMLLGAYREHDASGAQERTMQDLRHVEGEDAQIRSLDWFWDAAGSSPAGDAASDLLATRVRELDVRGWSFLARGYLAAMLRARFPAIQPPAGVRRFDRVAVGLVRGFSYVRMEHVGCGFYLPLLVGIAAGYFALLNHTLGKIPKHLHLWDLVLLAFWILATIVTTHTHFSGHETLRSRFYMALSLYAAIFCFFAGTLVLHLTLR